MPVAKSISRLPSTSSMIEPDARAVTMGWTLNTACGMAAFRRSNHSRDFGPGISVTTFRSCGMSIARPSGRDCRSSVPRRAGRPRGHPRDVSRAAGVAPKPRLSAYLRPSAGPVRGRPRFEEARMATALKTWKLFIGGAWVDPAAGETEQDIDPATTDPVAEVAVASEEDVERAVKAAKKAYEDVWFDTPPKERSAMMLKLADAMEGDVDNLRYFAGAARNMEGKNTGEYERGFTSWIRREPLGVTAGICPWNYPLMMAIWKVAPALAAGNVSILKPAELTPQTTLRLAELSADILPPGVISVVTGRGSVVGAALCRHPDVSLVSITGDTATGKLVAKEAADTVKRVHLELGGKAPVVVFDDADVSKLV